MILLAWFILVTPLQTAEIQEVFLSAFLSQHRPSKEHLEHYFTNKIIPRLDSPKNQLCTISFKDKIIGFALFEKWEENCYYLAEMAVLPKYQRQGLGKKLVFSICEKDPQTQKIILITEQNNIQAQSFYQAIGFHPSSFRHPDYHQNFIGFEYSRIPVTARAITSQTLTDVRTAMKINYF